MKPPKPLVIVPTYLSEKGDADITLTAIESVRRTQGDDVKILVSDDCSPSDSEFKSMLEMADELKFEVQTNDENLGFSKTVNVGLEMARDNGQDAILLNADMDITSMNWLSHFRATTDLRQEKAAVVGALLLYPDGTIQHAGIYLSLLTRSWDHRFKYGPGNLPEALHKEVCPVTGAFQYIRHSTLEKIGLYDEDFKMGWEDVDYCIRVFLAGDQCVFNPNVRGFHHEYKFRGRPSKKIEEWQRESLYHFVKKYAQTSFAEFVPNN